MSMLGAKKMRARRKAMKVWRDTVAYWIANGHDLNGLIIPKEVPRYILERIVAEERLRHARPMLNVIAAAATAASEALRAE